MAVAPADEVVAGVGPGRELDLRADDIAAAAGDVAHLVVIGHADDGAVDFEVAEVVDPTTGQPEKGNGRQQQHNVADCFHKFDFFNK